MQIIIIDPSSTEFNRGSFCYAPYILYCGLKTLGNDVLLYETFRPEDLDQIEAAIDDEKPDAIIVTLWSYPQIETSVLLAEFIPYMKGVKVHFMGYNPLIKHLGLPSIKEVIGEDPFESTAFLEMALANYPTYFKDFDRLLLSDCDMHLAIKETGQTVYPLFTTFGCPNGCAFCPATVNCGRKRTELSFNFVYEMFYKCSYQGIRYIHLMDEDFFANIDRANGILQFLKGKGFCLNALSSSSQLVRYINKYGVQTIEDAGLEIIEIGLETADEDVAKNMGAAKNRDKCEQLLHLVKGTSINLFWLVMTFFPGETIGSLNRTGDFMRAHGYETHEVVPRLRTNGTKGGLGQFFQPYHGTPIYEGLREQGVFLTERPIRLLPSYLPSSFVNDVIKEVHIERLPMAKPWLKMYNLTNKEWVIHDLNMAPAPVSIGKVLSTHQTKYQMMRTAMFLAILARWRVIE